MRRRDFIALAAGAMTRPGVARAQQPAKVYRIFWVSTEPQPDPFLEGFREGLRQRGYAEGKDPNCWISFDHLVRAEQDGR